LATSGSSHNSKPAILHAVYYTDVVKIDPGIAGTAMLIGKLTWDMIQRRAVRVTSPTARIPQGRRRPYLMFCPIPLALSFWLLFSLPQGMSNLTAFFAIIGTFVLFDTFHTMITMAYQSMSAS
jgi:Na+/melibiose symporter-like transporter